RVLNNPELIVAELDRQREGTSAQQVDLDRERQHYIRQLAQCEKELERWYAAYAKEVITLEDFQALKAALDARRASAERECTRLDERQRLIEQAELKTAALYGLLHPCLDEGATRDAGREATGAGSARYHCDMASRVA